MIRDWNLQPCFKANIMTFATNRMATVSNNHYSFFQNELYLSFSKVQLNKRVPGGAPLICTMQYTCL